jgi:cyclopropane-fatty-acyl-phospholipid synthase
MSIRPRQIITQLLGECDIRINGDAPYDIRVRNDDFYVRALVNGSLGLGESYMDGWWEVEDLDGFIYRLISAQIDERVWSWRQLSAYLIAGVFNLQRRTRAFQIGQRHYDLGK